MSLRVAVDATAMPSLRAGAGTYVTELLRAVDPSTAELHVFVKDADADEIAKLIPSATLHPVRVAGRATRIAWSHSVLPLRVGRLRPEVFHGPHYTVPAGLPCPAVVTFHDPTFFSLAHLHERSKVAYFTRTARTGIKRAKRVIAVSGYARQGAIQFAGAEADRVDVVHEGVDLDRYTPGEARTPGAGEAQPPAVPYVLFVATLEPRKDVPTLIAAFDELDAPHELILAGQPGWGMREIELAIARARKKTIRLAGYVSEDEKIDLYRGASAFVYPSIAEGFGLPVLEAMACGAPVITTTGSAPEEIAGDGALLVPPQDTAALRDALQRVLTDDAFASDLRRRGLERAQCYSWTTAAAKTVDVWRRAAGKR